MGQEESKPVDESTPPQTLEKRDLASVAKYIKNGQAKRIVVMTGAGISTAAGIPDFRSPDTGLYASLADLDLPYPEAIFDISYFRDDPLPFYALAHELFPGKYQPTLTHYFLRLLSDKGLLLKLFTQNIDCLEREAGVPGDAIVEAHGSFARQSCIECRTSFPDDQMRKIIKEKGVPHCVRPSCDGLVKPEIVFFGEALPETFHMNRTLPAAADLCIVLGTSLSVQPFASLPSFCKEGVPRVLINLERAGGLGSRPDDVLVLGDCDTGVRKLADALGWLEELEGLWKTTHPDAGKEDTHHESMNKDQRLETEVRKLATEIDHTLKVSNTHANRVRSELRNTGVNGKEAGKGERLDTSASQLAAASNQSETLLRSTKDDEDDTKPTSSS